ncbi:MAG TPA: hypothetical protein VNW97_15480 [Candidatus Saccharimonadales bacterium]|nr:hypothetical protein [Candidatus Saccharimonadales bacterium]
MLRYSRYSRFFLLAVPALMAVLAVAQQNPRRLILKDGSYQTVTQYQVAGERVRYYSAERYAWEELPKSLIDWPATEKYNQERDARRANSAAETDTDKDKEEAADLHAEEAESPLVAPGLRLPDGGGVFLLDQFHGEPSLAELVQSGGELNKQMGRNILRAALNPLALSSKQTIEIIGIHAKSQSHLTQPEVYVNIDNTGENAALPGDNGKAKDRKPQLPFDRFRIIRMERRKDARVVGNLNIAVYGKVTQKANWIKTTSTKVGDWVKVAPAEPLAPGEYAVVEMLDEKQMNIYVWDFGVDPKAPANLSTWTPRQPAGDKKSEQEPTLQKRPK